MTVLVPSKTEAAPVVYVFAEVPAVLPTMKDFSFGEGRISFSIPHPAELRSEFDTADVLVQQDSLSLRYSRNRVTVDAMHTEIAAYQRATNHLSEAEIRSEDSDIVSAVLNAELVYQLFCMAADQHMDWDETEEGIYERLAAEVDRTYRKLVASSPMGFAEHLQTIGDPTLTNVGNHMAKLQAQE